MSFDVLSLRKHRLYAKGDLIDLSLAYPNSKYDADARLAPRDWAFGEQEGAVVPRELDLALQKVVTVVPKLALDSAYRRLISLAWRWAAPWLEPKLEAKTSRRRPSIGRLRPAN